MKSWLAFVRGCLQECKTVVTSLVNERDDLKGLLKKVALEERAYVEEGKRLE